MDDAALAAAASIPLPVLLAIREVESGGSTRALRFEPHVFNRLTDNRYASNIPFTPDPARGVSLTPSETGRAAFENARGYDAEAAVRATSWGRYQVLGGHLLRLYGSPSAGVAAFDAAPARVSDELLVAWFQANPSAADAARRYDITTLAAAYNGSERWAQRVATALEGMQIGGVGLGGGIAIGVGLGLMGLGAWYAWRRFR